MRATRESERRIKEGNLIGKPILGGEAGSRLLLKRESTVSHDGNLEGFSWRLTSFVQASEFVVIARTHARRAADGNGVKKSISGIKCPAKIAATGGVDANVERGI